MKRRANLEDAPKGKLTIVDDFLPPPSQLVRKTDTVKVTSEFTRSSIDFLKKEARKAKVPYQRMLRALLDRYVEQHSA
jgi:predicted DNA binding CopG/RHH family protein